MKKLTKSSIDPAFLLFCTFLKRNNANKAFIRNISESRIYSYIASLDDCSPDCYILYAFRWTSTPEGGKYWDRLNDKWRLVLNLFNF